MRYERGGHPIHGNTFGTRNQKVKVVYGIGLLKESIGQISTISGKLLTLYGEGGPAIGNVQTLVLLIHN